MKNIFTAFLVLALTLVGFADSSMTGGSDNVNLESSNNFTAPTNTFKDIVVSNLFITGNGVTVLGRDVKSREGGIAGPFAAAFGVGNLAMSNSIVAGSSNVAGYYSAVFGELNFAGTYGAAFGLNNLAARGGLVFGSNSIASVNGFSAGVGAQASQSTGVFVFADSSTTNIFNRTSFPNSFNVRAVGGTYFETPILTVSGKIYDNDNLTTNWTFSQTSSNVTLHTYKSGSPSTVIVPNYINGLPVTALLTSIFNGNTNITSISGGTNLLTIGTYAFNGAYKLTNVYLPSVKTIGDYGFNLCTNLFSIDLPSVGDIGINSMARCSNLVSVAIPLVTNIQFGAFYDSTNRFTLALYNIISVSNNAFQKCGLRRLEIYTNVMPEGASVFYDTPATTYVMSATATGWGSTWNGQPVVQYSGIQLTATGLYARGTATWWQDVQMPMSSAGGGNASMQAFRGSSINVLGFPKNTDSDFQLQTSHGMKTNGEVRIHMHPIMSSANTSVVSGRVEWTWANINGTFPAVITNYWSFTPSGAAWEQRVVALIVATNMLTDSGTIVGRVLRQDTGNDVMFVPFMDAHIEMQSLGSDNEIP